MAKWDKTNTVCKFFLFMLKIRGKERIVKVSKNFELLLVECWSNCPLFTELSDKLNRFLQLLLWLLRAITHSGGSKLSGWRDQLGKNSSRPLRLISQRYGFESSCPCHEPWEWQCLQANGFLQQPFETSELLTDLFYFYLLVAMLKKVLRPLWNFCTEKMYFKQLENPSDRMRY